MTILLDIDGVLVITPAWKRVEILADGFMKFDENAVKNLSILHQYTNASVILTTTHRINFGIAQWKEIFEFRGLHFSHISKLNEKTAISQLQDKGTEIGDWIEKEGGNTNYVIIDDDLSLHALPENIKTRWVLTRPLIGFDKECLEKALSILTGETHFL